jgi:protocatechuate 3,4-dioxygenase beta subunit
MMHTGRFARSHTDALPNAANAAHPFPHDRVLQPGPGLARLWADAGLIRSDITTGFNNVSGAAHGVPMDLHLSFHDIHHPGHAMAGRAIYVWHADAAGQYSVFNLPHRNYLRGVGITDGLGRVRFRTIYPGTYRGRPPHIHFEVYRNLDALRCGAARQFRSSMLFPDPVSRAIYASHEAYRDSRTAYDSLMFEPPVTDPENDARAVRLATVTAAGRDHLRARLQVLMDAAP